MSTVGSVLTAVGDTPLVRLSEITPARGAQIHLKLEWFNPTGSCKDRMALAMIEGAERRGAIEPGMTVVEYTGGSTGSSLAFVCAAKGYRFHAVSSDAYAKEKLRTMRAFGAELTIVPSTDGRITPDLIPRMREEVERLADRSDTYLPTSSTTPITSPATDVSARSCSLNSTGHPTSSASPSAPLACSWGSRRCCVPRTVRHGSSHSSPRPPRSSQEVRRGRITSRASAWGSCLRSCARRSTTMSCRSTRRSAGRPHGASPAKTASSPEGSAG